MSKSGTQAQTRTKVSKKPEKTPKKITATLYNSDNIDDDIITPTPKQINEMAKVSVKNAKKTPRGFTKENQPEKRVRPAGRYISERL